MAALKIRLIRKICGAGGFLAKAASFGLKAHCPLAGLAAIYRM
jgi:hypothetical protein